MGNVSSILRGVQAEATLELQPFGLPARGRGDRDGQCREGVGFHKLKTYRQ